MLKSPSLANLTAFIAVGKKKSFRKAANDLMLTPGAVSQKIKNLESQLGCSLLNRSNQGVTFTDKGERYYREIAPLIMEILEVTRAIFDQTQKRTSLVISVMPSFALRWLIPRLDKFHKQYPDLTININATERVIDFETDDVDLAIRHGLGEYSGLCVDRMFSEDLVPVCSSKLLQKRKPLVEAADLLHHTLLHDNIAKDWFLVLSALKLTNIDAHAGPRFNDDSLMIQSAIEGHGVALARMSLVKNEIDSGDLIVPFNFYLPSEFAYYAVSPNKRHTIPETRVFREWLLKEAVIYSQSIDN